MKSTSQEQPLSFLENLAQNLQDDKEEDTQRLFQEICDNNLSEEDYLAKKGRVLRIFENLNCHIPEDDERMKQLVISYTTVYQKLKNNKADRFKQEKQFMLNILEKFAFKDLINPENGWLNDKLMKILEAEDAYKDINDLNKKKDITTNIVNAYIFYLLSATALNFEKTQGLKKTQQINFQAIQDQLVQYNIIASIAKNETYLLNPDFKKAHNLIISSVNTDSTERHYFFSASARAKVNELFTLFNENPKISSQIQDNMAYYQMLGESYVFAVNAFLTEVSGVERSAALTEEPSGELLEEKEIKKNETEMEERNPLNPKK